MSFRIIERDWRDTLGEGPTWCVRTGRLIWVDIVGQAVHRLDPVTGVIESTAVDQPIGWALPIDGSERYLCGLRAGFAAIDIRTGAYSLFASPEADRPDNRLNDAKVDPQGRIWAGSKDDTDRTASGALYRIDPGLTWVRMDDGYGVTNGPTFSPCGKTLYHTDSAARTVFAFDLAETGDLSNKRIWLKFEDQWGYPDGMTTDAEGCIWIAHWGGGQISRFSAEAELIGSIILPASNITSCCFAGEKADRMFVTSSSIGREHEPHAGALFQIEAGVSGLPPTPFGKAAAALVERMVLTKGQAIG